MRGLHSACCSPTAEVTVGRPRLRESCFIASLLRPIREKSRTRSGGESTESRESSSAQTDKVIRVDHLYMKSLAVAVLSNNRIRSDTRGVSKTDGFVLRAHLRGLDGLK